MIRRAYEQNPIDALLDARGIDELEDEIRDREYTERAQEEFLTDNRWPDTWLL